MAKCRKLGNKKNNSKIHALVKGVDVYLTDVDVTSVLAGTCPTDGGSSLGSRPGPAIGNDQSTKGEGVSRRPERQAAVWPDVGLLPGEYGSE